MEEVDSISVAVSGIDINKVEPLDSRRIVAFINHFLCTTTTFLNQFASYCESKLEDMQHKIHRVESRLKILECKLESIPPQTISSTANSNVSQLPSMEETVNGRSQDQAISMSNDSASEAGDQHKIPPPPPPLPENKTGEYDKESIPDSEEGFKGQSSSSSDTGNLGSEVDGDNNKSNKVNTREDPRYTKYFKMAAVGVPIPAIKLKMQSEGVDPFVLDL